jgi:mRNA-degrading endonuclease RelE of RelBE toxin-antitoxin system
MSIEMYSLTYIHPDFDKQADRLIEKKKFRKLPSQIAELVVELEKGNFAGDILFHSDNPPYDVFKVRLPNEDTKVGKSNGYRIIYLARYDNRTVAFLFIYYKKEQESVADSYVSALIEGYFLDSLPAED